MSILTVIEGAVVAIVAGALKEDIGWGIAAFIIFMILYCVPILRETLSIMASLVEAMIVYELVTLRNWKCEFCGRINDESASACISCGALRK